MESDGSPFFNAVVSFIVVMVTLVTFYILISLLKKKLSKTAHHALGQ